MMTITPITMNATTIWEQCLTMIKSQITEQGFNTWFAPIKAVQIQDKTLRLQLPSVMFYEWLEEHHVDLLGRVLFSVLGEGASLEYEVPQSQEKQTQLEEQQKQKKRNDFKTHLNENYVFDNFIEGDCNRLGRAAGIAIGERPGLTFNPLLVYGGVGLGKTHLVHAIGNLVRTKYPEKNILYISSEKFINQFVDAILTGSTQSFNKFYKEVDVLIVDDVQFFSGKEKTQENFFHIFNELFNNKKAIILTSDCPPKDLKGLEDRLVSRFNSGLVVDVQLPDYETRLAILQKKISDDGIIIEQTVIEYIAQHVTSNIRELEGCIISLLAQSSLGNRSVDIQLAKEVLQNIIKSKPKEVSIETIQSIVANHFDLELDVLNGSSRKKEIAHARQVAMYLCKKLTENSYKVIGEKFGGRDHSTVVHAFQTIGESLKEDRKFRELVSLLEMQISNY